MKIFAKLLMVVLAALPFAAPSAVLDDDERVYFSDAELDQMLAPIALYPDSVLSHVLVASTYPLEVVQAARWSREHPDLDGQDAVDAVEDRDWDPSVKALVAFPEILARMDDDLDWTQRLGDAFLDQEAHVMDRVQELRERAYDAGHLDSVEHLSVRRESEVIYIEPAVRHIVYVPYYDPWVVYGTWWWPAYPPLVWHSPYHVGYFSAGFFWGHGFHVSPALHHTHIHWHNHYVVRRPPTRGGAWWLDIVRNDDGNRWRHDPAHRRGVAYRSERLNREHGRVAANRAPVGRVDRSGPARQQDTRRQDTRQQDTRQQAPRDNRAERERPRRESADRSRPRDEPRQHRESRPDRDAARSDRAESRGRREEARADRGARPEQRPEQRRERTYSAADYRARGSSSDADRSARRDASANARRYSTDRGHGPRPAEARGRGRPDDAGAARESRESRAAPAASPEPARRHASPPAAADGNAAHGNAQRGGRGPDGPRGRGRQDERRDRGR